MIAIALGMPTIILLMIAVMGAPIVYFSKRDAAYHATRNQPEDIRLKTWYE